VLSSNLLVAHTGFEPVISSLRGRCPRPLDECAKLTGHSGHISNFLRPDLVPRLRAMLMKSSARQYRHYTNRGVRGQHRVQVAGALETASELLFEKGHLIPTASALISLVG
jgi:hypothetical protein